jgi:hypothetical protein
LNIPKDIARCPTCNRGLFLEVNEWEDDTGIPTEEGTKPMCPVFHRNSEADRLPYVYWLPIEVKVYAWARDHVRVFWTGKETVLLPQEEYDGRTDAAKLAAWEAWAKGA